MTRMGELQAAAKSVLCATCVADVDQVQAALREGVREIAGVSLLEHRDAVSAAMYVLYDGMRRTVTEAVREGADPADVVNALIALASDAVLATTTMGAP